MKKILIAAFMLFFFLVKQKEIFHIAQNIIQ